MKDDEMPTDLPIAALPELKNFSGSLAQRVYKALLQAILSLSYPPGTVLQKAVICEQLGVSRHPVSEAITRLAAEGLVDVVPQSATTVSSFSLDEIREAMFLREALEVAAVRKVAAQHTEEQFTRLSRNVRLQKLLADDDDRDGFYEADEEFHALIMEFTGYPKLSAVASSVSLQLKRARLLLLPQSGRPAEAAAEHQAILDAIQNRDADTAVAQMRLHLGQLISQFEPLEKQRPELFRP
ncbi:MAG: GntR family transcriptional regulator [Maritimibacter sp.]